MSSAPKDEPGRARRRRRRGGAPASRPDNESAPSRPPRRPSQQPHNHNQHHAQDGPANPSASHAANQHRNHRNASESDRLRKPGSRDRFQSPQGTPSASPQRTLDEQAKLDERKRLEEEAAKERERKEKEERERAQREKQLAEQRARRELERNLNLSYRSSKSGDAATKERPSDSELRQYDSSLKKCTGFLRKLRFTGVTEESAQALSQEAKSLNLSRYISEVVSAISESKLRSADVEPLLTLCGELYRRYEDFIPELVPALAAVIVNPGANSIPRDLSSRRAAMRLLADLYVLGMSTDINPVTSVLRQLVRSSKEPKDEPLSSLTIVSSFVRSGARTMLPRKAQDNDKKVHGEETQMHDIEEWEDQVLPQATKTAVMSALQAYYDTEVTRLLENAAQDLKAAGLALSRSKSGRGDPDDAAAASGFESAKQFYDKVVASAKVLAEALGKDGPESVMSVTEDGSPAEDRNSSQNATQVLVTNPLNFLGRNRLEQEVDTHVDHPFESEEERIFYTDLPFSRESNPKGIEHRKAGEVISESGDKPISARDRSESKRSSHSEPDSTSRGESKSGGTSRNTENRRRASEKHISLDKLISRLSSVESKESVDNFVTLYADTAEGSKNAPKRLAKSLVSVSPQKLNLLPAYARIAASLFQVNSDVAVTVASSLEGEFRYLAGRSDIDDKNLAVSVKTAKYVGEYVKFGLMGTSTMLDLLGICMKDFSGHRVDMACHLLETCGRFVYRTPSTHIRMGTMLETLWRLKSVKNLEARHNALVETAFYAARPTSANKLQQQKSRPVLHEYIRHLIYYRLDASNIKWTQNQLLKLPWNDDLEHYVIKKFVKISRARFSTIPYVSTLIAWLQRFKPALGVGIVDALLESIRSGIEKNDGRESQCRIAEIQLLGELFKCGVVDERVIYNVLYQTITLGHDSADTSPSRPKTPSTQPNPSAEGENPARMAGAQRSSIGMFTSAPDPPGDFFRIRIACVLIESCGRVLVASNRRKLEVFWIFLERYIFCKTHQAGLGDRLPLHINHVVGDAFEHVLQRERRLNRDSRNPSRREVEGLSLGNGGRHESSRQGELLRSFARCTSLSQSMEAVHLVEQSSSDMPLICVPSRHIGESTQMRTEEQSPMGSSKDATAVKPETDVVPPFRERDTEIRAASVDEDGDNFSDEYRAEEDYDVDDHESLPGDMTQQDFDENGTVDDATESLSLDDMEDTNNLYGYDDEDVENDSEEDDEENDEDDDDDDDDDDDYDDVLLDVKVARPQTEEEDAFAKELAAFTAAAVQTARASSSKVTKFDRMAIPMALMTKKMQEERAAAAAAAARDESDSSSEDGASAKRRKKQGFGVSAVEFKMLVRKGGKSQLQDLKVPATSSLALAAKENETADAARHEETKRLVLGSTIVLNHDEDDLDDEVPLRTQQSVRAKEESIRQQRSADEMELLSTLYRTKPRR